MKKLIVTFIFIGLLLLGILAALVSCNYQMIDTEYNFTHAYISYGDGTVEKVKIKSWRDFEDSDQIQVTAEDGTVYLTDSENCTLVKEGK